MGRRTSILALDQIREINMTPLIDLTFLLLITFIITFPLLEQGIPVNLPRSKADDLEDTVTRTITLNAEGKLFLERQSVTKENLAEQMQSLGRSAPDAVVRVRADERIAYGKLVEVLKILHDAKIARMALVTAAEQ